MEFSELNPEEIERASNMIKAISHPMRLAILGYLGKGNQLSVTEIHNLLDIEQSTASHHLGILKDKGVLSSKREGKTNNSDCWYKGFIISSATALSTSS